MGPIEKDCTKMDKESRLASSGPSKSVSGARPRFPPVSRDNLLQKFMLRETFGQVRSRRKPTKHESTNRFFSHSLPARLAFCLKDVVPMSAIEAGHIFLGFSKCGQFLLSYTQTTADIDLTSSRHMDYITNYRLHWWLFVPSKRAKKVAEVLLFSNQGAYGNLLISFCQWPKDMKRMVVYGVVTGDNEMESSSKPCYLTVTTVPSLNSCKDCAKVAASYGDDDVAEAWNSCVRLSCLEHGLTVHTTFDIVRPYPMFEPKISLKKDGYIIINTGNLLHSVKIQLENLVQCDQIENFPAPPKPSTSSRPIKLSHSQVGTSELSISTTGFNEVFSPPMPSPASVILHSATSDSETTDCDSESGYHHQSGSGIPLHIKNEERLERVAHFVNQIYSRSSPRKSLRLNRSISQQQADPECSSSSFSCKKSMAEKAYELTDDDFDDGVREKLSTFRKKRLAEKTYEFKDEDAENVTPFHRKTSQQVEQMILPMVSTEDQEFGMRCIKSPRSSELEENILRPIISNQRSSASLYSEKGLDEQTLSSTVTIPVPDQNSPNGGSTSKQQSLFSPTNRSLVQHQNINNRFHAKFTRRYVELDDEMVSVITDIEDEDLGSSLTSNMGYHAALPLEVHGSGYQAMAVISNSKAGKLTGRCLKVMQRSFDLEVFCHHMAQKLCQSANIKYWYCNDYDVEIVDMDTETGDVLFVAFVLIQATMFIKKQQPWSPGGASHQSSNVKQQKQPYIGYETSFKFCWNVDTTDCTIIDSEPLREVNICQENVALWHPAKEISVVLQKKFQVTSASRVRCFTNEAVLKGVSMKTIFDSEHLLAIINDHLD